MGRYRKELPRFTPPAERGAIRVADVLAAEPGTERDAEMLSWCESVWAAWEDAHAQIAELCEQELGIKE